MESFRRAIAINPGAPAYQWTLLSTAYARAKRPADAREAMNTFLRLSPHLMEGRPGETVKAMRIQIELAQRGYYLEIIDGDIGKQSRRPWPLSSEIRASSFLSSRMTRRSPAWASTRTRLYLVRERRKISRGSGWRLLLPDAPTRK